MKKLSTTSEAIQLLRNRMQHYSKVNIPETIMALIARDFELEVYEKGDYFCRQGGHTNKSGFLLSGNAKAARDDMDHAPQILKFFMPGDFLSADNAQENGTSDRDIVFTENSLVFTVYDLQKNIGAVYLQFPEINHIMLGMYMEEVEKVRQIGVMRGIAEARERITYYYKHFGELDNYFSGKDIANFMGLQRETFSRHKAEVLKKL